MFCTEMECATKPIINRHEENKIIVPDKIFQSGSSVETIKPVANNIAPRI